MEKLVKVKIVRNKELVKELLKTIGTREAYIMGGFARHCCSPNKAQNYSDIDIYCRDEKAFESMRKKLKSIGLIEHKKEYKVCIMYRKNKNVFNNLKVQLIKPIEDFNLKTKGSIEDILRNFDFSIARVGILNENYCIADEDFLKDEKAKKIRVKFIHCPISSTIRLMKYAKKGYKISPREVFKLFMDWDNRDDDYINTLYNLFEKADKGEITDVEIEHLERLLRRD